MLIIIIAHAKVSTLLTIVEYAKKPVVAGNGGEFSGHHDPHSGDLICAVPFPIDFLQTRLNLGKTPNSSI